MLFKSSEVSPPITEDRGFCTKRQATEVSLFLSFTGHLIFIVGLYAGSKLPLL